MKVLYSLDYFPTLSETYVVTELDYMVRHGVEVAVWARHSTSGVPFRNRFKTVYADSIGEVIEKHGIGRPDLIHCHFIHVGHDTLRYIPHGIPITVRGHSFDFAPSLVQRLLYHESVKRIWLFPHFVGRCAADPRISPLPVAYDSTRYRPAYDSEKPGIVYRAGSARPGKDMEAFIRIATRVKARARCRFVLDASTAVPVPRYVPDVLMRMNADAGSPVEIRWQVPHDEAADMMRQASIYLRGHDNNEHPYGMPVSVAEAMATGCWIVHKDLPEARQYVGDAGRYYRSEEEAAQIVLDLLTQGPDVSVPSLDRAKLYADERVLPVVLGEWRRQTLDKVPSGL